MTDLDRELARARGVLDYLDGLLRLRSRVVRDIDEYDEVRWLVDLPQVERGLFTARAGIDRDQWLDLSRCATGDGDDTYERLFALQQAVTRLGEEHELVLGVGLLAMHADGEEPIRRHLLSLRVSLTFDASLGTLSLGPADEEPSWCVEIDVLGSGEAAGIARQELADRLARGRALFDRERIDESLGVFARRWRGEYLPGRMRPVVPGARPLIALAPALIVRRRVHDPVLEVVQRIREQLQAGARVAPLLRRICELPAPSCAPEPPGDREPFFPLPVNREQLEIHERLRQSDGVTVQGPPGTGKTHTIANLICDLLAQGKRVLVTSKTSRALRVVHRMLPPEIQPLCVSVLDGGKEDQDLLEAGVRRIVDRRLQWNADAHGRRVAALTDRLASLRAEEGEIERRLLLLVERERREHQLFSGSWSGTAARIARRLLREEGVFGWIPDDVAEDATPPSLELLEQVRQAVQAMPRARRAELQQRRPRLADLASAERFERQAGDWLSAWGEAAAPVARPAGWLVGASRSDLLLAAGSLDAFLDTVEPILGRSDWARSALTDVLFGQADRWSELLSASRERLIGLLEAARKVDDQPLAVPEQTDLSTMIGDVEDLCEHLRRGGWLFGGPFARPVVKRTRYVWREVRFDGRPCRTPGQLDVLLHNLRTRQRVAQLLRSWAGRFDRPRGSLAEQVVATTEQVDALATILAVRELSQQLATSLTRIGAAAATALCDVDALRTTRSAVRAALDDSARQDVELAFDQLAAPLAALQPAADRHPLVDELAQAVARRDVAAYRRGLERLATLERDDVAAARRDEVMQRLAGVLPLLAAEIDADPDRPGWPERFCVLGEAFDHARARTWLRRHRAGDERGLRHRLGRVEARRRQAATELAAALAWQHAFGRMSEDEGEGLIGWQQAMRRAATAVGLDALEARRDARRHLRACRLSIPAWVLPLRRVYDTLPPEQGMFDVVIVDEASQCGQEGLPLFHYARKILVVGDDQQITPTPVGIGRKDVRRLLEQCLPDLEHRDLFGPDASLFDHAMRRFGDRIVLREHFRCVPEIIRFSDELCYASTPLVPLRQPPLDRLPPLRTVLVPDGRREGSGGLVYNEPEARALVDTLVACAADPGYVGRSFGVIALQGTRQAKLIEEQLLLRLGPAEFAARRIACGNPYAFQGDERDVVFLSLVAAREDIGGAMTRGDFVRRFNVAASRARDQMWLFHSLWPHDFSTGDLRRRLLDFFLDRQVQTAPVGLDATLLAAEIQYADRSIASPPDPFESWLEVDVALELAQRGYRVLPGQRFGDRRLDLVVHGDHSRLALECAGDRVFAASAATALAGRRLLERCGWNCHTVLGSEFYSDRALALRELTDALDRLDIAPLERKELHSGRARQAVAAANGEAPGTAAVVSPPRAASRTTRRKGEPRREELLLQPFDPWPARALRDPRIAPLDEVLAALVEIVTAEGPTVCERAYRVYTRAAGLDRKDAAVHLLLDRAMRRAIELEVLEVVDEAAELSLATVRVADSPAVVPRRRGERQFDEIPPAELAEVMSHVVAARPHEPVDQLFRAVRFVYEVTKEDQAVLDRLRAAYLRIS